MTPTEQEYVPPPQVAQHHRTLVSLVHESKARSQQTWGRTFVDASTDNPNQAKILETREEVGKWTRSLRKQ